MSGCQEKLQILKLIKNYLLFADDLFDDTSSLSSSQSGTHSNLNYYSGDEHHHHLSPIRSDHKQVTFSRPHQNINVPYRQCKVDIDSLSHGASSSKTKRVPNDNRRLTRNSSLVDIRSQLLHRSLVEEVNKRRLFKTVGAVENIGFQAPCEVSNKKVSKRISKQKEKNSGSYF